MHKPKLRNLKNNPRLLLFLSFTFHQIPKKKDTAVNAHSMCTYFVGCSSLGNSTESQVQQSSMTKSLSLERGIPRQHFHNTKQLSFQFQDQDSSSSQSTGQSYPEVASVRDNILYGGYENHRMLVGGYAKLASLTGTRDIVYPPSQVDYSKSSTHIPVHYAEPYLGSVAATAYGLQATIHHGHMMAMFPTRVPLPLDLKEDEPIYVNAKQYHAILRRRQYRARLEAQNKVIKVRKPYLHESRHLHALKRVRGSGGQFLNTKKLQESKSMSTSQGPNMSRSPQLHLSAKISKTEVHRWKLFKDAASATSCSDVTSASNSDEMFQQTDFRFSSYHCDHIGEAMPVHTGDIRGDGSLHHLSCLFQ